MRAILLRRMMVLGVCAVGVAALYLVPGVGAPTTRVSAPAPGSYITPPRSAATSSPSGAATATDTGSVAARSASRSTFTPSTTSYTTAAERSASAAPAPTPTEVRATSIRSTIATRTGDARPGGRPSRAMTGEDVVPPEPVADLAVQRVDPDQVRLGWAPGQDDVGVTGYRVWLNGYEVRYTVDTEVTLDWFNDDNATQVVAVRAVDGAGNQSPRAAMLLLTRPEPSAAPAPRLTAPDSAASDPGVDPTADPTLDQTPDPTGDPTTDPTSDPTTDPATGPTTDPTVGATARPTPTPSPQPTPAADRIR